MFGNPQQQLELEPFQVKDWYPQRQKAVRSLPRKTKRIAEHILAGIKNGPIGYYHQSDKQKQIANRYYAAIKKLPDLNSRDREKLFAAFFPKIAVYMEAAWQMHTQLPIQGGYGRKAFRAPHRSDLLAPGQIAWFQTILNFLKGYDPDLPWLTVWAPNLFPYHQGETVGSLLAAGINHDDETGEEVFEILAASARGEHEQGVVGRHLITALLSCEREEAWELVENLLKAAQRQEGLRQVILESIDLAQPGAFLRMLHLILDQKLLRFSSAVRAADVWFGLRWDSAKAREIEAILRDVLKLFEEKDALAEALRSADPQRRYLALWVTAFWNAPDAVAPAAQLLKHEQVEMRFIGAHFLGVLNLPAGRKRLVQALRDNDLNIVVTALEALNPYAYFVPQQFAPEGVFETLEEILPQLPQELKREALVWPWMELTIKRRSVAAMLRRYLGDRSPLRLLPFVAYFDPRERSGFVRLLSNQKGAAAKTRSILLELIGDRSSYVREEAFAGLKKHVAKQALAEDEIEFLEALLTRKSSDLRRGVLAVLLHDPESGLASAARLVAYRNKQQRLAGLEILQELHADGKYLQETETLSRQMLDKVHARAADERMLIETLLGEEQESLTLAEGLGLYDPRDRTVPQSPKKHPHLLKAGNGRSLLSDNAKALWHSLDDFVHQHRNEPIQFTGWRGEREELLGNLRHHFAPATAAGTDQAAKADPPLADQLSNWWKSEGRALAGPDRLALLQAEVAGLSGSSHPYMQRLPGWVKRLIRELFGNLDLRKIRYPEGVKSYIQWLNYLYPAENTPDYLLDAVEHSLALIPKKELRRKPRDMKHRGYVIHPGRTWRDEHSLFGWLGQAQGQRALNPESWLPEHDVRLYQLLRWIDEPVTGLELPRKQPRLDYALAAFAAGGATRVDLFDHILQSPNAMYLGSDLYSHSGLKPSVLQQQYPVLTGIVDQIRSQVVAIELQRGDLPTEVSAMATALRYSGGMEVLIGLLAVFGRTNFVRGYSFTNNTSKAMVFSRLIQATYPGEEDTPGAFAEAVKERGLSDKRLVELAVYAPQWAGHVQAALDWEGLADGVWWLHGHTKDNHWRVDPAMREHWAAAISERTPLTAQDLLDGAVDVNWFQRAYASLGEERWNQLYQAAKLASGGRGHTRAKLFADAMLDAAEKDTLLERLTEKRYQDAARALGLLPLPKGKGRKKEILARHKTLQEFLRTGRKFGAQRRTSEKLAVRIGLENLARTAGYADPARLQWDMEAEEVADLVDGRLEATAGDITVCLEITPWGTPDLQVHKADGRRLKNVPPRVKKEPQIARVLELRTTVKKQASRMRRSLEEAMIRGDRFQGRDLRNLLQHPTLGVMLSQLVMLGESATGFPVVRGKHLEHYDGSKALIKVNDTFRIAHPVDLLAAGDWHAWQKVCFQQERIQPFKQVFRELYVLTEAEKRDVKTSQRYAGHQVNSRQAMGLLSSRLWVSRPDEGISRTFHEEGIIAHLDLLFTWGTPAEVEGSTMEGVVFSRRDGFGLIDLEDVPERLYSEVMRDLDLVVSVAHRGGVDPEASHSTIEMRTALLRETLPWTKIDNVVLKNSWALIEGQRGNYNVHLGSGVVHLQPGGALCIIPVHAQHRGRLFLPFADDDPRTAEVISKVLLLARDKEIRDPTILEQIV